MYRASTDQAYESTLKLLSLDQSERSAQRSAEGAADAAADAKANLDEALASANAAKTVVEKIAAIRGRERRKNEEEGIIPGSTDVSATPGIKGRAAQTKTRVIEAAGVITPAEARQIREATRQYEESLDDITAAWVRVGQARVRRDPHRGHPHRSRETRHHPQIVGGGVERPRAVPRSEGGHPSRPRRGQEQDQGTGWGPHRD